MERQQDFRHGDIVRMEGLEWIVQAGVTTSGVAAPYYRLSRLNGSGGWETAYVSWAVLSATGKREEAVT